MELWEQREAWDEATAKQFDKNAQALRESALEYFQMKPTAYSAHMALVCSVKADGWTEAARSLRQARNMRLELEDYERLTKRD